MKTTTEVAAKVPAPNCGMQGNNLVIAPDKGQTRFTAWIITRDQAGETMVTDCLEIPLIGIGDYAPPIVKENIVEQFTWINGHPYEGVSYFLQVFAYDANNVQSEPDEITLITKQADKPASITPPSVASKPTTATPTVIKEDRALQGWINWMCKWLQMWVEPVLAQLKDKRPSRKTLREIPQFTQNFIRDLNELKGAHPNDSRVMKVNEMFEKFQASAMELNQMWEEQEKQREEAAKAAPVPTPQPVAPPTPAKPQGDTGEVATKKVASTAELAHVSGPLEEAQKILEKAESANDVGSATSLIQVAEQKLKSIIAAYPDTEPRQIEALQKDILVLKGVAEGAMLGLRTATSSQAQVRVMEEEIARVKAAAEKRVAEVIRGEEERKAQERKRAEDDRRAAREEAERFQNARQVQTPVPWYKRYGWRIAIGLIVLGILIAAISPFFGVKWWKVLSKKEVTPSALTATDTNAPVTDVTNTNSALVPLVGTNTPDVAATSTPVPTTSPSSDTAKTPSATNAVMPSVPDGRFVNVANEIKLETDVMGGINGDGNMVGNGQVNINSTTHNYYGLGPKTPSNGSSLGIKIPEQLNIPKGFDGWRWTTNLCAGQTLGYEVSKGWRLRAISEFKEGELLMEILGHDGNWHTIIPGSTNAVGGTQYRFTVASDATETVVIKFHLRPK